MNERRHIRGLRRSGTRLWGKRRRGRRRGCRRGGRILRDLDEKKIVEQQEKELKNIKRN